MMSLARNSQHSATIFASLCVFRLINALLLQTQFDPDEYWQTLEPAYCEAFPDRPCAYTWEWTRRAPPSSTMFQQALQGPVRSYISILPTYLFYQCLRLLGMDTWFWISKGPMLLHAVFVAAVTDYCVWYCASPTAAQWTLLCSLTSWFHAYTLVRTYSNSLETVLLIAGVALLSASPRKSQLNAPLAFWLGGISVAIRFTSLAAWIPLGVQWGLYQVEIHARQKKLQFFNLLLYPCALYGVLGFGVSLLIDRWFFGFWAVPALGNFHFNVVEGLGSLYGTLPAHWYLTACLPAITGTMFPILLWGPNRDSVRMWTIVGGYVLLHSLSAHKELRFMLPMLPLLSIIAGKSLATHFGSRRIPFRIGLIFCVVNLIPFVYLGMMHQRGSLDVNRSIIKDIQQQDYISASPPVIHVHYLMGCHSTPLYSHLHAAGSAVRARYLDCSPSCRSNTGSCESDIFQQDPIGFLEQEYASSCNDYDFSTGTKQYDDEESSSCPSFVVMCSEHAVRAGRHLEALGMKEVGRFFHSIQGVNMLRGSSTIGVEFQLSEIVLYGRETCSVVVKSQT